MDNSSSLQKFKQEANISKNIVMVSRVNGLQYSILPRPIHQATKGHSASVTISTAAAAAAAAATTTATVAPVSANMTFQTNLNSIVTNSQASFSAGLAQLQPNIRQSLPLAPQQHFPSMNSSSQHIQQRQQQQQQQQQATTTSPYTTATRIAFPPIYDAMNAIPFPIQQSLPLGGGGTKPVPVPVLNLIHPGANVDNNQAAAAAAAAAAEKHITGKLATVPTKKLSANSIVSLNTSSFARTGGITLPNHSKNGNPSLGGESSSSQQTIIQTVRNQRPQHVNDATTKQLDDWLASSYSSASNATIIAQKMKKSIVSDPTTQTTMVQQDTGNTHNKPSVSLKRPAPTSVRNHSESHKYIKVVGGKHQVPRCIPDVSIMQQKHFFSHLQYSSPSRVLY